MRFPAFFWMYLMKIGNRSKELSKGFPLVTTRRIKNAALLNDKYNKYNTIRSALKLATDWQQPHVCSFIRLEIMLIWSGIGKKWMAKMDEKKMEKR